MEPSPGIEGVILNRKECRLVKAELDVYPTSIQYGQDQDIRRTIERMETIKQSLRRLSSFTIESVVAYKLAANIERCLGEDKQVASGTELSSGDEYPQTAVDMTGHAFFLWRSDERRKKLGAGLTENANRSRNIQHERV
jgi:hypothetical protein